jgi:hypothetical protein
MGTKVGTVAYYARLGIGSMDAAASSIGELYSVHTQIYLARRILAFRMALCNVVLPKSTVSPDGGAPEGRGSSFHRPYQSP